MILAGFVVDQRTEFSKWRDRPPTPAAGRGGRRGAGLVRCLRRDVRVAAGARALVAAGWRSSVNTVPCRWPGNTWWPG